ncbi:MAG: hypothetical protein AAF721_30095 [Myxococcota bacterium]
MEHSFEIQHRGDHLWVSQRGCLPTVAAARAMQQQIEHEVQTTGCRLAVFDNRQTEPSPPAVRDTMFEWALGDTFLRVAVLLDGEMTAVRANMQALASGGALKAFADVDAARSWVTR